MLVIRLQRTGRRGHAQFRAVVQDSKFSATSGRVVAYVGSYNPHTKEAKLDVEKISQYLANGAQPSPRITSILKAEKVKLPGWVSEAGKKERAVRYPEKRRKTSPVVEPEAAAEPAEETPVAEETPATDAETPAEEAPAAESDATEAGEAPSDEAPAETPVAEETPATDAETPAEEAPAAEESAE